MLTIAIAIQKGGSGKTTTAINLAAALQQRGQRVLLVDMDPQANLTHALGFIQEPERNMYHLLKQAADGDDVDVTAFLKMSESGLMLIPSALELASAEMELVSVYGREHLLSGALSILRGSYDVVLIDCPPSIGLLTVNALVASDAVLMPLQAEFLPLKGLRSFMRSFQTIKTRLNRRLEIMGIVLTRFDDRKDMNRRLLQELTDEFGEKVFKTRIRSNIALAKAQERGQDIFSFDKKSNGAKDYAALADEVLARVGLEIRELGIGD